jgi:transposase-like protein
MGQLLHSRARTTKEIRREIQLCKKSIAKSAILFNVNPKTIIKWRNRDHVTDLPMGPKKVKSTVLSESEEAAIVSFRKLTQLPLDDILYALQTQIPKLTRSNLHRCLQRHGCSVLVKPAHTLRIKQKFKKYPMGYFHVDVAEVKTAEGKLYLHVGIDRITKFCYAELHTTQTKLIAADFLRNLIRSVPYKINKILTDNGIQFTNHDRHIYAFPHIFDLICNENKIEHRTTQVKHPWTNGQVERMNRTLKEATVKTYYYDTHDQLKTHLHAYLMAYNFAKRLKALHGKTPWEFIQKEWEGSPELFNFDPNQFFMGPNIILF